MKNNKHPTPAYPKLKSIINPKVFSVVALLFFLVFIKSLPIKGQLFALGITGPSVLLIGAVYLVKGKVNLHPAYLAITGLVLLMIVASFFALF